MMSSSGQPPKTWFHRHWKGVVVAILLLIVALLVAAVLAVVGLVMWSIRQSDVYRMAMERVRQDPAVVQRLGSPIESGWIVSGSMNIEGDSGTANFTIPIHGPRASAKVYLDARKTMGEWTFNSLVVKTAEGEEIQMPPAKADCRETGAPPDCGTRLTK
jgi:hypothetical protein